MTSGWRCSPPRSTRRGYPAPARPWLRRGPPAEASRPAAGAAARLGACWMHGACSIPGPAPRRTEVKARFVRFGIVEIDGQRYERDVMVVQGRVQRRHKKACLLYTSDAADEEDSVDLGGRR